jgi:hypothetical protein
VHLEASLHKKSWQQMAAGMGSGDKVKKSAANPLPRFASKWCFFVLFGAFQCN